MANKFLVTLALILSASANALPGDRKQPINIEADRAVMNDITRTIVYEGEVLVEQGSLQIRGNRVEITTNEQNEVEQFVSTGTPATFENQRLAEQAEPIVGTADTIEYSFETDLIVLNGDAEIQSEGSAFSGPLITYRLETGEVIASGDRGNRVSMTMQPKRTND